MKPIAFGGGIQPIKFPTKKQGEQHWLVNLDVNRNIYMTDMNKISPAIPMIDHN